jgi:hypothetical protein
MKDKHRKLAVEIGQAHAQHLFETFQNPEFRGPKFLWSHFPGIAAGLAKAGVAMSCADWDDLNVEDRKQLKDAAFQAAQDHANELLANYVGDLEIS